MFVVCRVSLAQTVEAEIGNRKGANQHTAKEDRKKFSEATENRTSEVAAQKAGFGNRVTYKQAAALASYARQSEDDQLEKMAMRIRARAIRRAGELLELVQPAKNQHDNSAGAGGGIGRKQAASDAGMSHRQMHTALRVANVPPAAISTRNKNEH